MSRSVTVDTKLNNSKPGYDTAYRYNIRRSKWMLSTNLLLVYHIYVMKFWVEKLSQICPTSHRTRFTCVSFYRTTSW